MFNFVSDLVGKLAVIGFGLVVPVLYVLLMSWQVKSGRTIPIQRLGEIPRDFFAAAQLSRSLKWSLPGVIMALLFLAVDFSHSIADLGLGFVTVEQEGPSDTILDLGSRNPSRLIHTAGDPLNKFNFMFPSALHQEGGLALANDQLELLSSFLEAPDLIARGGSPFITKNAFVFSGCDTGVWGGVNASCEYAARSDDNFLTQIDFEIPLNCTSTEMIPIDITSLENQESRVPLETLALVPNCTYRSRRSTGIYGLNPAAASVQEVVSVDVYSYTGAESDVFLTNDSGRFQSFNATHEMKELARFRDDWKKGREVEGIEGIQIGTLDIALGAVVLGTGVEEASDINDDASDFLETGILWIRRSAYGLVGEILGGCPPRPSGAPAVHNICFVVIILTCESFPEDTENLFLNEYAVEMGLQETAYADSPCHVETVKIVWGNGFDPDPEMVAVMAGMYGRVRPNPLDLVGERQFILNTAFAAMFAMGTLDTRPSIVNEVSPEINGVYMGFMLLPFVILVGAAAVGIATCCSRFPIPRNPWELMIFGSEEADNIKKRERKTENFPKPDPKLALTHLGGSELAIVSLSDNKIDTPSSHGSQEAEEGVAVSPTVNWRSDAVAAAPTEKGNDANLKPKMEEPSGAYLYEL